MTENLIECEWKARLNGKLGAQLVHASFDPHFNCEFPLARIYSAWKNKIQN